MATVGPRCGIALVGLALAACGESSAPTAGSTSSGPVASTTAAGTDDRGDTSTGGSLATTTSGPGTTAAESTGDIPGLPTIGPTMGTLALDFRLQVSGAGSLDVGAIAIIDGYGTIEIAGRPRPIVVHERQPWPAQGYTLFQGIAVADDAWTIVWMYCADGALTDLYVESTDGIALHPEVASGTCDGPLGSVEVDVDLPGTELAVVANGDPFTIEGPDISVVAGELGTVAVGGVDYVVAPFETVDCTTCGMGGWYEVHAILWDPIGGRMCFSIAYLEGPGQVSLTYAISLPDLTDPIGGEVVLGADWTYG